MLVCGFSPLTAGQEAVPPVEVDFTLLDVQGKPFKLSNNRGRWVIINFWATWCSPCLREIPELVWLHDRYRSRAMVVGINYETIKTRNLKNFMHKHKINYPVLRIGPEPLAPFEPLVGLPSTFFVSPQGQYVARHIGPLTVGEIERFLRDQPNIGAGSTNAGR